MSHRNPSLLILLTLGLTTVSFACRQRERVENHQMRGTWQLASYSYTDMDIPFEGDLPQPQALENWLYAKGREGFANLKPATGVRLMIRDDGSHSEVKTDADLHLLWYDADGSQIASPCQTDGLVRPSQNANEAYLHPSQVPSTLTRSREKEREWLRYDDGDTLVCDLVRIEGESLVRIVSVVTDEIYLSRIVAVYKSVE